MSRLKRFLRWVPCILIVAVLYFLGRGLFHIYQPILFLGVVIPGLSAAYLVSMYYLAQDNN